MATFTVGDLVLHGNAAGLSQFYLGPDGVTGWDEISDSKSPINERPGADGAFTPSTDFRASQVISAENCWYNGVDRADALAASARLRGMLAKGVMLSAVMEDDDGQWRRSVSIRSVRIPPIGRQPVFSFDINMVAPDPLMYGESVTLTTGVPTSGGGLQWPLGTRREDGTVDPTRPYWDWGADGTSGRVSFTNTGTAATWPTLTGSGGLSGGFIVTDVTTGQIVRFERPIPIGSVVTLNSRTGRAWIDDPSNDVSGYLTTADDGFFSIGPGETHQIQFAPLGVVTGVPVFSFTASPAR